MARNDKTKAAGAADTATDDPVVTHIGVRTKKGPFRRAGRDWGETETVVDLDTLSDAAVQALVDEPALVVVFYAEGVAVLS
jgi:hypothetical protein